jgi:hypothetical protein
MLKYTFLNFIKTKVIRVENKSGIFKVKIIRGINIPWQIEQGLNVVYLH